MADHQQIADFIQRRVAVGRVQPGADYRFLAYYPMPYYGWPLATVEEMGEAFFRDAEFRALQLVRFLKTPTGEFLEQAVELAAPRALAPEFALIVGALKFAAARQHGETTGKAALAVLSAIVIGVIIKEVGKAA